MNTSLRELDLSWNGVSYDGSVALRRVLVMNKSLRHLNISNCNIDWINAKLLTEGLKKNSTLQKLSVKYFSDEISTHK